MPAIRFNSLLRSFGYASALYALSACGPMLKATKVDNTTGPWTGIPYALPMTVFVVEADVTEKTDAKPAADSQASKQAAAADAAKTPKKADPPPAKSDLTATITLTPQRVPDPRKRYVIQHQEADWFSDEMSIGISDTGLLKSISAVGEDKTGEAVIAVVNTAINIFKLIHGVPSGGTADVLRVKPCKAPTIDQITNTLKRLKGGHSAFAALPAAEGDATTDLPGGYGTITVSATPVGAQNALATDDAAATNVRNSESDAAKADGIKVVVPEPYRVRASLQVVGSSANGEIIRDACPAEIVSVDTVSLVPDHSPVFTVSMDRASLVKTERKLELTDGMVSKSSIVRPSPALAGAQLPLAITERLVKLPTELIQLKFDITSKEKELATVQQQLATLRTTERLQVQLDLTNKQKELEAAQQQLQVLRATSRDDLNQAILTSQIARLQAEIDLLKKRLELSEVPVTPPTN
jgi:hypothetical protein